MTFSQEEGYRFFFETRTFVLWWETKQKHFFDVTVFIEGN
jgi:hypothetical protein